MFNKVIVQNQPNGINMLTAFFCRTLPIVLGWMLILSSPQRVIAQDEVWLDDVDKAIATAKADGKDLLLLYTGSDWCPPCKKLEEEVFGQDEFLTEAKRNFVFVILDFPREKKLAPETVKQNAVWASKYGIEGYPTVVLIDKNQKPYGISGYREGGVENYLGILGEFHQQRIRRDEAFTAAEKLEGKERAEMLDKALSEMEVELAELYYDDIVQEIVSIDKEDASGLRTKWNASKDSEMRKIIMTDIVVISRLEKPETAIKFVDEVLNEIKFPASQKLKIFQIKLGLLRKQNDLESMDALLDEMISMEELTIESRQRLLVKKVLLMAGTNRRDKAIKLLDDSLKTAVHHSSLLWLAKGQLLMTEKKFEEAIKCFDTGMLRANGAPDVLVELYGAKADCHMSLDNELRAIQTLDEFAENDSMPADLRSEAMLQKAMIMRDSGRERRATLVENRAIEISDSTQEQTEMRKLVNRLRKKYGS